MAETAIEHIKERLKIIRNVLTEFESNKRNLIPILQTNTEVVKDEPTNIREKNGYMIRSNLVQLKHIFNKFASKEHGNEKFMSPKDFICDYLELFPGESFNEQSVNLLASIVDSDKDGLISFQEFANFEALLCVPDALYKIAFHLFDSDGNGIITYGEFKNIITETVLQQKIPLNMETGFVQLYFGNEKKRVINYNEFTQLLHDFHEELAREIFRRCDRKGNGSITFDEFKMLMTTFKNHLLTPELRKCLINDSRFIDKFGMEITFPYFMAFNSLLNNMDLIKRIYLNASNGRHSKLISKDAFLRSTQTMSQITPLEVDILFKLCQLITDNTLLSYHDLNVISPDLYFKQIQQHFAEVKAVSSPEQRGVVIQLLETIYRFLLGAIAGAIGATSVYPIDLVKTRMQNQRTGSLVGELMYRNSFDCFMKVVRHEGVLGLYRGLAAQLMGVAPEKAIKLTVNDFVRDMLRDKLGNISLMGQIFAGACAGASQVVFTNPLEIVKIRLQVAGELSGQLSNSSAKVSAMTIVRNLGFLGLYKGAKACFLRDVPFSAIYFPVYAYIKSQLADDNGYNSPFTLLLSGIIAGIPAASIVTPADVIKTRLQVVARTGQTTYNGVMDASRKIFKEEGFRAFWKGTAARVLRSSPQFGVTLLTYEILQRLFYVDFCGSRPSGSEINTPCSELVVNAILQNPDHIGGYQLAQPLFRGIETKFGLTFRRN